MQKLKIDVTKIDKTALFKGAKGIYLDVTLFENKTGREQYEQDGFIVQDISRERRDAGEKGAIIGNWKHIEIKTAAHSSAKPVPTPVQEDDNDDIPF